VGELLAVSALVMFSSNIVLTKVASARMIVSLGFLVSVTVNVLFAFLLVAAQLALRQAPLSLDISALLLFFIAGFFSTYLGRWFLYDSVVKIGPSRASAFQTSNPAFTALIAWFFLDERLGPVDIASMVAILVGLYLTSRRPPERGIGAVVQPVAQDATQNGPQSPPKHRRTSPLLDSGVLLALSGALAYAVSNILRGVAIDEWNEPLVGALAGALAGLVSYVAVGSGARRFLRSVGGLDRKGVYLYAISGVLTICAQACMIAAMWYLPVSIAIVITLSTPILVIPAGYFLLKNREGITLWTVLGSAAVLTGVGTILLT
jgi:drug/metabolite transporter (DMT)-like permease